MVSQEAIANYLMAKEAFAEASLRVQGTLGELDWRLVAKDVSDYLEDAHYQYWLVSPEMCHSLDFDQEWPDAAEAPVIASDPDPKWVENTDYLIID